MRFSFIVREETARGGRASSAPTTSTVRQDQANRDRPVRQRTAAGVAGSTNRLRKRWRTNSRRRGRPPLRPGNMADNGASCVSLPIHTR